MGRTCQKCKSSNLERRSSMRHLGNGNIFIVYPIYCKDCGKIVEDIIF